MSDLSKIGQGFLTAIPAYGLDPLCGAMSALWQAHLGRGGPPSQFSSSWPFRAHREMRTHLAGREFGSATPTAFHPRPRRVSTLKLQAPPSSVHVVEGRRPLRAYWEVRTHIDPGKLGAAAPTAFHPRPSWAPDKIKCRVLLKLPYTNPTPTLSTALRHTMDQIQFLLGHVSIQTTEQDLGCKQKLRYAVNDKMGIEP
jgi:hypothetical protein